jgi:hypothetical protein
MKQVKIFISLSVALISFSAATAQTSKKPVVDEKISAKFSKAITKMNKTDLSQPKQIQQAASQLLAEGEPIVDFNTQLKAETERSKKEIENKRKEYTPESGNHKSQLIDKELLSLLASMPEPVVSLPDAKKAMKGKYDETVFALYIEKLKRYHDQMAEIARKSIPDDMKDAELAKKKAYENAAKAQQAVNNNAVIQEMGGIENLKNMTPAQREALAKQMAAKVKQNPTAYTGAEHDPRKAFTQKLMKDPNYAARFNGMNDRQKKEEYELFMKENGFVDNTTQADRDKTLAERDEAATLIAIEQRLATIRKHAGELAGIAGQLESGTEEYFNDLTKKIAAVYGERVQALPLVEHGEAGKERETLPVDIAFQIVQYPVNAQHAIASKEVWKRYVEVLKIMVAEYNDLLNDFWGKDKTTDRLMAERQLVPAAIIAGLCTELIHLTQTASLQTSQNASWQKVYDERVLHIYE